MLDLRIENCEKEETNVIKCMTVLSKGVNGKSLAKLKTAINGLDKAVIRVRETGKEIYSHNRQNSTSTMPYMTRCHEKEVDKVVDTDELADRAQRLLEDKTQEHKDTSPEDMKKLSMDLRPTVIFKKDLSLEEQDAWFKQFTSFYKWNEAVLVNQPYDTKRQVLHNCISVGLRMELTTDPSMSKEDGTAIEIPVVGNLPDAVNDCLFKLKEYLLVENPIHLQRHNFQNLTQQDGQKFGDWWAEKVNMVKQCRMDKGLTKKEILILELIKGVYDPKLRQELIRHSHETSFEGLVKIAKAWDATLCRRGLHWMKRKKQGKVQRRTIRERMTIGIRSTRHKIRGTNREIRGQEITSSRYADIARRNTPGESAQHTGKNAMDAASCTTTQESAIAEKDEKEIGRRDVGAAKIITHGAAIEMRRQQETPRPKKPCEEPEWQKTLTTECHAHGMGNGRKRWNRDSKFGQGQRSAQKGVRALQR